MPDGSPNVNETIQQIKDEIEKLRQEQEKVLDQAVYVGMHSAQAKLYDERFDKIKNLLEQLARLVKPE